MQDHYDTYIPFGCSCNEKGECAGPCEACHANECLACGERDCPHHEPLHYHHDSCPACFFDEEKNKNQQKEI